MARRIRSSTAISRRTERSRRSKQLGQKEAVTLLLETLQEEKATDAKLSMLVVGKIAEESSAK
jgi:ferritin-like metal-binding protein YciE